MPFAVLIVLGACNDVPEGTAVAIQPEAPLTTDDLTVAITTPAEDRHEVSYRYAWTLNGNPRPDLTEDTIPASATEKGDTWTVRVTPTDGRVDGETVEATTTILNAPPAGSLTLDPDAPTTLDDLRASFEAEDADGDDVIVRWSWTVDGSASTVNGNVVRAQATSKGQIWEVTATPSDGQTDGEPVTAQVQIGNEAPEAASVRLDPTLVYENTVVTAVPTGSDADGEPLVWTYSWFVDSAVVKEGPEDTLDGASFDKGQVLRVEATVTDGDATDGPVVSPEVTVRNVAPTIGEVVITPPSPVGGDDLTCTANEVVDIDGDEVTLTTTWTVDGRPAGVGPTLAGADLVRGDVVRCFVTATDGEASSASIVSDPVTVGNTAPVIAGVSLSPSTVSGADEVTAIPSGVMDPDGDPVTLTTTWRVGGRTLGTGPTLSSGHVRGDVLVVTVEPFDGFDTGVAVTASTTVVNAIPSTPEVVIDPGSPGDEDDLVCEIATASTDADGDTLTTTLTWSRNGVAWTGATTTTTTSGDTIAAADTVLGDTWTCEVEVTDGRATVSGEDEVDVKESQDWVLFTTATFIGSTSGSGRVELASRADADAECASRASAEGVSGSDWKIVYSTATEDAKDYLDYDAGRGDRVFDRNGTRIDGGDLWGSGRVSLPDLKSWTITGTGNDGTYTTCSGTPTPGTWPICQSCSRKFACASASDDPFNPGSCCWTGVRAILCMGER